MCKKKKIVTHNTQRNQVQKNEEYQNKSLKH